MSIINFNPHANSVAIYCRIDSKADPNKFYNIRMVVDTGASYTLVSPKVLHSLGYDIESASKHISIICVEGVITVPLIKVRRLWLGEEIVENLEVVCHNLPEESKVRGLLGLDCLRRFNLKFLFDRGTLELQRIRKE